MRTDILVYLTLAKFKVFLRKSLGETWNFVDDIWNKFYNANQYQLENIMD